jgi:hypothetical protein
MFSPFILSLFILLSVSITHNGEIKMSKRERGRETIKIINEE